MCIVSSRATTEFFLLRKYDCYPKRGGKIGNIKLPIKIREGRKKREKKVTKNKCNGLKIKMWSYIDNYINNHFKDK